MGFETSRFSEEAVKRTKLGYSQECSIAGGEIADKEGPSACQEKIFQHEDSPVLKQAYQGGCAVFILVGFQDSTG